MKLEDLKLYQECLDFEQNIWDIVAEWEGFTKDTIGKSFVQAADAISGNIALGYGRYDFKDKKHFCYISRGYLLKTKGWIIKSKERDLIGAEQSDELIEFIEKIHRMLNAYIRSIGRKKDDFESGNNSNSSSSEGNSYKQPTSSQAESDSNEDNANGNTFTADADEFF